MALRKFFTISILLVIGAAMSLELSQLRGEQTDFTSFFARVFFEHNLHEVVPNTLYRSAQMPPEEVGKTVERLGIKTVIDLRLGKEDGEVEEEAEREIVQEKGASFVHLPLRGSRVPRPEKVQEIINTLDRAERPILVHCSSGTHRSGLVSAIYLLTQDPGQDAAKRAADQLSTRYGFFRVERELKSLFQGHPTIDYLLWMYLEQNKLEPLSFRAWQEQYSRHR